MFNLIWFAIVNSWHYLFFIACRGKTPSNSNVSTKNLYWQFWTDLRWSWLYHKQPKSLTNTLSLHYRLPWRQQCAPTPNHPRCKRRRGTARSRGRWRRSYRLGSARRSARRSLGSFCRSFIGKAPHHCTRERTRSSCAKWTDCCSARPLNQIMVLILRSRRVIWQTHEAKDAWGN